MPRKRTDTLHAGFSSRLRDLSVPGPLVKYSASSTHTAPTPAEGGRPADRTVATKNVSSVSGVSLTRMSRGRLHGSSACPYRSRLRIEVGSVMQSVLSHRAERRTVDRVGQFAGKVDGLSSGAGRAGIASSCRRITPSRSAHG